jgi:hypothetical protein
MIPIWAKCKNNVFILAYNRIPKETLWDKNLKNGRDKKSHTWPPLS